MVHILRVSTQFSSQSFAFSSDCKRSNFASFSNQKKFVRPARAAMSVAPLQTDEKTSTTALRPTVLCASANSVSLTHPKFKLLAGARHKTQLTALSVPNQLKGLCNSVATKTSNRSLFTQNRAVRHLEGSVLRTQNLRFAVVVARFNEFVTRRLLEGALDTFKKYAVNEEDIDVVWVPGSFEIGIVAENLGKSGKYQAVLCIGAVIRGDTSHYDAVVNSAASGVLSAGLNSGVPCVFGVLTCDDMDQAVNRAGGKAGNKGSEAALTAIEMASLFEHHLSEL